MTERELESLLTAHAAEIVAGEPEGPHLEDARADAVAQGEGALTDAERRHLVTCRECRTVLALALRARGDGSARGRTQTAGARRGVQVAGFALAASVALGVALVSRNVTPPHPERADAALTAKGLPAQLTAEVTFLATDRDGRRRDLREGETIALDERLGFKYGNPQGTHRTLTVLGWDGVQVRWYFPAGPEEAAFAVEGGPKALGLRLPEDIALGHAHRAGSLTVVAAFDAEPRALAAALSAGRLPPPPATVLRVRVEASRP